MDLLVIDAQGGGIGKQVVSGIKKKEINAFITAVGTNSAATSAMLKAGADEVATGENAVIVCCRKADVIVGPIGIVIADSMLGEITPNMARAIAQSGAKKFFIPTNQCNNFIIGFEKAPIGRLVEELVDKLTNL